MNIVFMLLYLLAGVCFGLAAGGKTFGNINTLPLGLLLWVLVPLINTV